MKSCYQEASIDGSDRANTCVLSHSMGQSKKDNNMDTNDELINEDELVANYGLTEQEIAEIDNPGIFEVQSGSLYPTEDD